MAPAPSSSLTDMCTILRGTSGEIPPTMVGSSITLVGNHVYVFGGRLASSSPTFTSTLYALSLRTLAWERLWPPTSDSDIIIPFSEGPSERYFHSAAAFGTSLIIFGGEGLANPEDVPPTPGSTVFSFDDAPPSLKAFNDIWVWNTIDRSWNKPFQTTRLGVTVPTPRFASLAFVPSTGTDWNKLYIIGGQDVETSKYIQEICVLDLENFVWERRERFEASVGVYRSFVASATWGVREGAAAEGGGRRLARSVPRHDDEPLLVFSNSESREEATVRRELDYVLPSADPSSLLAKYSVTPSSSLSLPPCLRFPSGAVVGRFLVVWGSDVSSSSSSTFTAWRLDLGPDGARTLLDRSGAELPRSFLQWTKLDLGDALSKGSWSKAVNLGNSLIVLGNSKGDASENYSKRQLTFDEVAVADLEAFGCYIPPFQQLSIEEQDLGLSLLAGKVSCDYDVVSVDRQYFRCPRSLLEGRWPWFKTRFSELISPCSAPNVDDSEVLMFRDEMATLALIQYFSTLSIHTPVQLATSTLSELLYFTRNQNDLVHLRSLVVHAFHEGLENRSIPTTPVFEAATKGACSALQVRSVRSVLNEVSPPTSPPLPIRSASRPSSQPRKPRSSSAASLQTVAESPLRPTFQRASQSQTLPSQSGRSSSRSTSSSPPEMIIAGSRPRGASVASTLRPSYSTSPSDRRLMSPTSPPPGRMNPLYSMSSSLPTAAAYATYQRAHHVGSPPPRPPPPQHALPESPSPIDTPPLERNSSSGESSPVDEMGMIRRSVSPAPSSGGTTIIGVNPSSIHASSKLLAVRVPYPPLQHFKGGGTLSLYLRTTNGTPISNTFISLSVRLTGTSDVAGGNLQPSRHFLVDQTFDFDVSQLGTKIEETIDVVLPEAVCCDCHDVRQSLPESASVELAPPKDGSAVKGSSIKVVYKADLVLKKKGWAKGAEKLSFSIPVGAVNPYGAFLDTFATRREALEGAARLSDKKWRTADSIELGSPTSPDVSGFAIESVSVLGSQHQYPSTISVPGSSAAHSPITLTLSYTSALIPTRLIICWKMVARTSSRDAESFARLLKSDALDVQLGRRLVPVFGDHMGGVVGGARLIPIELPRDAAAINEVTTEYEGDHTKVRVTGFFDASTELMSIPRSCNGEVRHFLVISVPLPGSLEPVKVEMELHRPEKPALVVTRGKASRGVKLTTLTGESMTKSRDRLSSNSTTSTISPLSSSGNDSGPSTPRDGQPLQLQTGLSPYGSPSSISPTESISASRGGWLKRGKSNSTSHSISDPKYRHISDGLSIQ
ncbi:hypothetical protein T439DRAFT_345007 [Meredithblackwellia eburnea MCA 4105]